MRDELPAIDGLLDHGLLSGQHEVTTVLRPQRPARPVEAADFDAALAEITYACQVWGGGGQPLLPVADGVIPDVYIQRLGIEQVDTVGGRQSHHLRNVPARVECGRSWDHPVITIAAQEAKDRWDPVQVVDLDPGDPWRGAYAAVLGHWPERPDASLTEWVRMREDIAFEDVFPVEHVHVSGSLEDLLTRASQRGYTPRTVANISLAYGSSRDHVFLGGSDNEIFDRTRRRRAAGPNIVVALGEGSVEDLALLWNLRGAYAPGRALPVGVPAEQLTTDVLRRLTEPEAALMFGFGGGTVHLVSATVPAATLEEVAAQSARLMVSSVEDLLTFGPAPGRYRTHLATWEGGVARLDPMTDADRDVLRIAQTMMRKPKLILDVRVTNRPLPADPTMRGTELYGRFQAGAAQVNVSDQRPRETVVVRWPSTWLTLAAVAQTKGVRVTESDPGRAAATLIQAIGGVRNIVLLANPDLIALLYAMAERTGMSWMKSRWSKVHSELLAAGVSEQILDRVAEEQGRDEPAVAPPGEGRAVDFEQFRKVLGSDAAAGSWVAWAERHHLLVRGADVRCRACGTTSWLPMAALSPPIVCPGCGRLISQPFDPRSLRFSYRLGEVLRRVLEFDCLGHVLALRWFVALFGERDLVGIHPGVDLKRADGAGIGEADLLVLFADGAIFPVEVKRRLAGTEGRTVELMDRIADALDAPCDVRRAVRDRSCPRRQ